jgi:hypothetical protein
MLTQNHSNLIKGFMGQTTAFKKRYIKSDVITLAKTNRWAKQDHSRNVGKGFWSYGGHDPSYQHYVVKSQLT